MKILKRRDLLWIAPLAFGLGALLSLLQPGAWLVGWLGFSLLFLFCLFLLTASARWAHGGKPLAWMVALAFALRLGGGVATYLLLPIDGHADADDRAGYVYTDAHRRDDQAWELAESNRLIGGFNRSYAYDQYGGLLTISAFVYRYLSPDAHRPLTLVLISAFMAALGLPFLWKSALSQWGRRVALASGWIYALYPESVLLGGSAMREPYLMAFSAFALWGFIGWLDKRPRALYWLALGIVGMLFVSPVVALATLVILAGWVFFASERGRIPWWAAAVVVAVFIIGLFILSAALDRNGNLGGNTPFAVINNFIRESFKWNLFKIEQGSGWVQKLFDEMPEWLRLPFVMVYGVFQPVLPAAIVEPTTATWQVIAILRALGWYALLPALILSFLAGASQGTDANRRIFLWLGFAVWGWILFSAMRGGGDQWDNPRYRAILFLWQAILAGGVWVWLRETRSAWAARILLMEGVFLLFFGQWYANRYYHFGGQLPFGVMVASILACWALILAWGWLTDRRKAARREV